MYLWVTIYIYSEDIQCSNARPTFSQHIQHRIYCFVSICTGNSYSACFQHHVPFGSILRVLAQRWDWYRVWQPPAFKTDSRCCLIKRTRRPILICGIFYHSLRKALCSWSTLTWRGSRVLTLMSSWSHGCSIGERSGVNDGHGNNANRFCSKKSWLTRAVQQCVDQHSPAVLSGYVAEHIAPTTTGWRMSSRYMIPVIPWTKINRVLPFIWMPAHTITAGLSSIL